MTVFAFRGSNFDHECRTSQVFRFTNVLKAAIRQWVYIDHVPRTEMQRHSHHGIHPKLH